MIEKAIFTHLSTDAGLTALVDTRIYPAGEVPQNPTRPFCTYQRISGGQNYAQDGRTGWTDPVFQFDIWAASRIGAQTVRAALIGAVDAFSGTIAGVVVEAAYIEDERDDYDQETKLHSHQMDVRVEHQE